MQLDRRTQSLSRFPKQLMKLLQLVPLAGNPQEEQSGPIQTIEFGAMPRTTQRHSLGPEPVSRKVFQALNRLAG